MFKLPLRRSLLLPGILGAALFILASSANADRVDDLKHEGRRAYCQWATEHILNGSIARLKGKPLVFRIVSEAEMKAEQTSAEPTPNTINLIDADKWSDQEVRHVEKHITEGWKLMDKFMKTHPDLEYKDFKPIIGVSIQTCLKSEEI